MYEKRRHTLAPFHVFVKRILRNIAIGISIILISLIIGISGYSYFEGLGLIDSFENAAMILSGMGQVYALKTTGGKIFASLYALFSGIIFLVTMAIIMTPVFHRFMHKFYMKE